MKRILLVTSLLVVATQIPVQAQPQVLSKIISPATQQMLQENFHAYAYDAKQLASKAPQFAEKVFQGTETILTMPFVLAGKGLKGLAKGLEYGAKAIEPEVTARVKAIEPTVTPIFEAIGNGLISTGNGLVYVGTNYPATSMVALSALSVASLAKAIDCDQNNKTKQANFYMCAGAALGIASMVVVANVLVENGIQF
jgi:hypothetical protein